MAKYYTEDERLEENISRGIKVDKIDEHLLRSNLWTIGNHGYAYNSSLYILLHQMIMGEAPEGKLIDHKNSDRLDCTRNNLRFVTQRQNMRNIGHAKDMQITFHGRDGLYRARIYIGAFDTEEEAIEQGEKLMKIVKDAGYSFPHAL